MEHKPPIIATSALGAPISFTREERARHLFLVGKSGAGKSTVLFNLAMHDIVTGQGLMVLDPHGDLAEALVDAIPPERTHDVCYLNVADADFPVGFNPLARQPRERYALAAAGVVDAFRHVWRDSWGPRLEHHLYNGVAALLESPRPTLLELARMYTDPEFRTRVVAHVTDPMVAQFWKAEYPRYDQRFQAEAASAILNKVGQLTASPILRNVLGQVSPKFDLAYAANNRKILIANLAKGQIGEQASNLLGSLLVSHLQLVAMARSDQPAEARVPFAVHVDEFGSFSSEAFASLLSEARKFAIELSLATQFTAQQNDVIRAAVLGNAGTLMVFRVSAADAVLLAPEFHPLPPHQLVDQAPFRAWLRRPDGDHRAVQCSPHVFASRNRAHSVIEQSRRHFGRPRGLIERSYGATSH